MIYAEEMRTVSTKKVSDVPGSLKSLTHQVAAKNLVVDVPELGVHQAD